MEIKYYTYKDPVRSDYTEVWAARSDGVEKRLSPKDNKDNQFYYQTKWHKPERLGDKPISTAIKFNSSCWKEITEAEAFLYLL